MIRGIIDADTSINMDSLGGQNILGDSFSGQSVRTNVGGLCIDLCYG
jgi:hypothetical protein